MTDEEQSFAVQNNTSRMQEAGLAVGQEGSQQNLVGGEKRRRLQISLPECLFFVIIDLAAAMVMVEDYNSMKASIFLSGRNAQIDPGAVFLVDSPGRLSVNLLAKIIFFDVRKGEMMS